MYVCFTLSQSIGATTDLRDPPSRWIPSDSDKSNFLFGSIETGTISILVSADKCVHTYVNGVLKKTMQLKVKKPLWGVVDLSGKCTEIRSELLSGELQYTNSCWCWYSTCYVCLPQVSI